MRKGIILGLLGALMIMLSAYALCCAYTPTKKTVDDQDEEQEEQEAEFLGEAASSIGTLAGVIMFAFIFFIFVGIALVIYSANKVAKNSANIGFDEKIRRFDKGLDMALKTKQIIKS